MKETLETAGRAWDAWEKFMTGIAMLGVVAGGVLLIVAPGELAEDFPQHHWAGIAMCVFGGVFLLALIGKGSVASRAKNFVLFLGAGAIAGGLGYGVLRQGKIVYELHHHGVERTLPVSSCMPQFHGDSTTWYVHMMDGARRITLEWDSKIERGTVLTVLTHPDHAMWTVALPAESTYLEIADAREARWFIILASVAAVIAALIALCFLWASLLGKAAPDETA